MFKTKTQKIDPATTDTLIGEGTVFEGKIKSEASIRIEGQITGDIDSVGDVTVGEKGTAKSNISARNITIAGTVHGNVTAKELLKIMKTGRLFGNSVAQSLIIEEGGFFQGNSRMETKHQSNEEKRISETKGTAASYPASSV